LITIRWHAPFYIPSFDFQAKTDQLSSPIHVSHSSWLGLRPPPAFQNPLLPGTKLLSKFIVVKLTNPS
jgi:hypothetical protein